MRVLKSRNKPGKAPSILPAIRYRIFYLNLRRDSSQNFGGLKTLSAGYLRAISTSFRTWG